MSIQEEVQLISNEILSAAAKGDFAPFVMALDDDVGTFYHAPYLLQGKADFLSYLQETVAGAASTAYTFHQLSCRAVTDTTVIVNAYDRLSISPKDGGPLKLQYGQATWVYAKKGKDWKIVGLHFSSLPNE